MLTANNYNPDVLSCLANLSNDEVFTPPQLCNQILDLLPATIWSDQKARFLDPVCKSGVFLREIAKRLDGWVGGADTQRAEEGKPHFHKPAFWYCYHGADILAFAPVGVLLQDRQREILGLRSIQRRAGQYPL